MRTFLSDPQPETSLQIVLISTRRAALTLVLTACVTGSNTGDPDASAGRGGVAGAGAAEGGDGAGVGGSSASAGSGGSDVATGAGATIGAGAGGDASDAGAALALSDASAGGAAGYATGGTTSDAPDAGRGDDANARCAAIASEYASSFMRQVTCDPGAGDQCQDRIEAAPGCDCLVFIEPKDPFAIENLLNVYIDWLDADCENSSCPDPCPTGTRGTCGSNGRCTDEP